MSDQRVLEWKLADTTGFWNDVAPGEHVLQIYETENDLLDMVAGYVGGGINAGDGIVLVATQAHLDAVENILKRHGIYSDHLQKHGLYFPLDASATLSKFMVNDWPDEGRFMDLMDQVINTAREAGNRRVRAFGEMVAILWKEGKYEATLELENLWNKFCRKNQLTLFCAYPENNFSDEHHESVPHVCCTHTKIITGASKPLTEILYKSLSA